MTDNLIGDRYVLGPLLGRGGMAEVRRARDTRLERDVAVKRLKADLAGDPVFQERFRREAHAAAGLNHPNIVSVFDTGESFDEVSGLMIPYIVMELVIGHTLREILHDGRKIQPIKALELTQYVLDALDYSHRHGIVHRDIKPANVMLTTTGQVKVMDFGIARAVSDTAASMTQTASVIGTPQYLSPEQIRGETVDRRSDIYSTGCLLYELLTGKPPFEGDSPVSLAYQHVRATPVTPSEVDPLVSTQMDAITLKALAKNPADRYQTAHDMYEDIARLLAGQKVQAVVPPPVEDDIPTQAMPMTDRTQVMPQRGVAPAKLPARGLPATQVEEEPSSNMGKIVAIILSVVLVIALITVGVVYAFNKKADTPPPPVNPSTSQVQVPNVISMTQDNATTTIQNANLQIDVKQVNLDNSTTAVGSVDSQDPKAGAMVNANSTVVVTVNLGPKKYEVPDVTGEPYEQAQQELQQTFTNVVAVEAPSEGPDAKVGTVLNTDPVAHGLATKDQKITIYYATGQATLPPLQGMSLNSAIIKLGQLGFSADNIIIQDEDNTTVPDGQVIDMTPASGSKVSKDTKITIYVARTPASPTPTTNPPTTPAPPTDNTSPSGGGSTGEPEGQNASHTGQ